MRDASADNAREPLDSDRTRAEHAIDDIRANPAESREGHIEFLTRLFEDARAAGGNAVLRALGKLK